MEGDSKSQERKDFTFRQAIWDPLYQKKEHPWRSKIFKKCLIARKVVLREGGMLVHPPEPIIRKGWVQREGDMCPPPLMSFFGVLKVELILRWTVIRKYRGLFVCLDIFRIGNNILLRNEFERCSTQRSGCSIWAFWLFNIDGQGAQF